MSFNLTFNELHEYDPADGIIVPVVLTAVGRSYKTLARLDTGASHCIFGRSHGEAIGLSIEEGLEERFTTATGIFVAYGHEVSVFALGCEFLTTAYFASSPTFSRDVLGRRGWLDRMRIGLIDYDGELYASRYDDTP